MTQDSPAIHDSEETSRWIEASPEVLEMITDRRAKFEVAKMYAREALENSVGIEPEVVIQPVAPAISMETLPEEHPQTADATDAGSLDVQFARHAVEEALKGTFN